MTPDDVVAAVHTWAAETGIHLVPTTLQTADRGIPSAHLAFDDMLALLRATRPPVVYLAAMPLDPETSVEEALEELGPEPDEASVRLVRREAATLPRHAGKIPNVFVEAVVNGVHHLCYAEADWSERFDEAVAEIAARASEEAEELRGSARTEAEAEIRGVAAALVADPAFNAGRPSAAKRRHLADDLFPDREDWILDRAVELAERMDWLAKARGQGPAGRPGIGEGGQ